MGTRTSLKTARHTLYNKYFMLIYYLSSIQSLVCVLICTNTRALTRIEAVESCFVGLFLGGCNMSRLDGPIEGDAHAEKNEQDPFHEAECERRLDASFHAE